MEQQIESDLKSAMLAGEKEKAETLRGLKSAILNEIISQQAKDSGLSDEEIQKVLAREAKKRAEAAELYEKANETGRAKAERDEKAIIDVYLPEQLDEVAIKAAVKEQINELGATGPGDMGRVIGAVRAKLGSSADGGVIARLVREALGV